jgi:hypothetical protein
MKRTLTLLLGLWVFTAPAVCGAICGDEPTSAARPGAVAERATTTELPTQSCHQTASGDRNEQNSKEQPAPLSDADCCAEGSSDSFQIETTKAPQNSFAHAGWAGEDVTAFLARVTTRPPQTEIDWIQSPYLRANPPLLI